MESPLQFIRKLLQPHQVFGYGSLVCAASRPARLLSVDAGFLQGWQRVWGHRIKTAHGGMTDLTVVRTTNVTIEGAVLHVSHSQLRGLDRREDGYQEVQVTLLGSPAPTILYATHEQRLAEPNEEYPVWQSYLDAVLVGYFRLGGLEAVNDLIKTTSNWGFPVYDDAKAPANLRAAELSTTDKAIVAAIRYHYPNLTRAPYVDRI